MKSRYPLSHELARPVQELGYTVVPDERRKTSRHHLYFERTNFNTPIGRIFRNLITNIVTLPNEQHQDLHRRYKGLIVPATGLMVEYVDDYLQEHEMIHIVSEKRTKQIIDITPDQWELAIRGEHGKRASQSLDYVSVR